MKQLLPILPCNNSHPLFLYVFQNTDGKKHINNYHCNLWTNDLFYCILKSNFFPDLTLKQDPKKPVCSHWRTLHKRCTISDNNRHHHTVIDDKLSVSTQKTWCKTNRPKNSFVHHKIKPFNFSMALAIKVSLTTFFSTFSFMFSVFLFVSCMYGSAMLIYHMEHSKGINKVFYHLTLFGWKQN